MIVRYNICLSELINSFPKYYYHSFKIPCNHIIKGKMMRKFLDDAKRKKISTLDGVKVWLGTNDWIHMIPDQHDQHLNLTIQAVNRIQGDRIYQTYRTKIQKWLLENIS